MPPTLLVQLIQHVHAQKAAMEARATAAEAELAALRAVERYIVDPPA
jgi:hypothetical protein